MIISISNRNLSIMPFLYNSWAIFPLYILRPHCVSLNSQTDGKISLNNDLNRNQTKRRYQTRFLWIMLSGRWREPNTIWHSPFWIMSMPLTFPPKLVPSVKLVFVQNERNGEHDTRTMSPLVSQPWYTGSVYQKCVYYLDIFEHKW